MTEQGFLETRPVKVIRRNALRLSKVRTFNMEEKNNFFRFKDMVKELFRKSSSYAVSKFGVSGSPYRRILWIGIFIFTLIGCIFQMHQSLVVYLEYDVIVDLHMDLRQQLEFPAVTICNVNRMKESYEKCLDLKIPWSVCKVLFKSDGPSSSSSSERRALQSCSNQLTGQFDPKKKLLLKFLMGFAGTTEEVRKASSTQANDFIKECSFNGQYCSSEQFDLFQNLKFGNCYTFNKYHGNATKCISSTTGYLSGLTLVLELETGEYLAHTDTFGARVVVHDPREMPNPEEKGTMLSPGFKTSISLSQMKVKRLGYPYKDKCKNYDVENVLSQRECIRFCVQMYSLQKCGCIDPTLPSVKDAQLCNLNNMTEVCCLDQLLEDLSSEEDPECDCPLPCFSTYYQETISIAKWPSKAKYFAENTSYDFNDYKKERLEVNIFYSTLVQRVFEQKPKFLQTEFFSHLGGELGLWMGLSLFATLELIEFIFYLVKYFWCKLGGGGGV